jgi:hypothetical protein
MATGDRCQRRLVPMLALRNDAVHAPASLKAPRTRSDAEAAGTRRSSIPISPTLLPRAAALLGST